MQPLFAQKHEKRRNKHEINTKTHEIKHSNKIILEQAKHLLNKEKCKIIENKYGKITDKVVLYRGKDETIEDIKHLNIEQFLSRLP